MSARILVVDDIKANRRMLQAKLEAGFHVVLEAENGLQALEIAERELPDVILLDVMMPGIDGHETCRRLKENSRTSHIPVVMVTALSETEDRVRGLQAGAEDFITKPVNDFQLNCRIEALSRYNAVAQELRQREATGMASGALDDTEISELNRPVRTLVLDQRDRRARRTAAVLHKAGHEVSLMSDAMEQSRKSAAGIDVIVLSLSDQTYDPMKICTYFRMSQMTRPISIIVAADREEKRVASRALAYGASDVIEYPIEPQELLARVRTQARRTRYIEIMRRRVDRGLELSVIDQLTGLYNRRYMMSKLQHWMKRSLVEEEALAVVALDIDHFKSVNDTHGHGAGDRVLQDIADRLRGNARPIDIVCRPGGEEFIIILPEADQQQGEAAAERIRAAVASAPFKLESGDEITVTLSAGVSVLAGKNDTPASLLGRADQALYQAKNSGRNRVCCMAA